MVSEEDQIAICKTIAVACIWGQGGIARVIIEDLDKNVKAFAPWEATYTANSKAARREHIGVIEDEQVLLTCLNLGYWLTNYDGDGCSVFYPPPTNGLHMYVSKDLAEKYRREVL